MRIFYFLLIMLMVCSVAIPDEKKTVEQDLVNAIEKIAVKNGVSKDEVLKKARAMMLDVEDWSKGGVGIIRDDMYVVTTSEKNQVIGRRISEIGTDSSSRQTISGANSITPEIFVFAGGKVIGSMCLPEDSEQDVVITLFTPEKIKIFDWKMLTGGYYFRVTESK